MQPTATYPGEVVCVPRAGTLYDVLELILDRGMVIDVFIRVSLVGIEILKIDVRIVVASVDTYLKFAEACNRLDLETDTRSKTVPELFGGGGGGGGGAARSIGKRKVKKAAASVGGKVKEVVGGGDEGNGDEEDEDESQESRPRRRSGTGTRSSTGTRSRARERAGR